MKKHLTVFLIALLLLCGGCGLAEPAIVQDPNVLDSQKYLPETVYFGTVLPLSGEYAAPAARAAAAQDVAVDIINNSHELAWSFAAGSGIPGYGAATVELVRRDSHAGEAADAPAAPETMTPAAAEPPAQTTEPAGQTTQPATATAQPATATAQPATGAAQPDTETAQPVAGTAQPDAGTAQPAGETAQPDAGTKQPPAPETTQSPTEAVAVSARSAAQELIDLGVSALSGAYLPQDTADAAKQAHRGALPLVSGAGGYSELTSVAYGFRDWFNRVAPTPAMESELLFTYLRQLNQTADAQISSVALVYEDTAYGQDVLAAFDAAAEASGFTVAARIAYEPGKSNVAEPVQRIITAEPDALLHAGQTADVLLFAETYATAQFTPSAAVTYGDCIRAYDFRNAMREAGIDYWSCYSLTPAAREADPAWTDDSLAAFEYINRLYKAKTGRDMDNAALAEFAAIIVLAQAVSANGATDADTLAATLKDMAFEAPYLAGGSIDFDEYGQNIVGGCILRLVGGELLFAYR